MYLIKHKKFKIRTYTHIFYLIKQFVEEERYIYVCVCVPKGYQDHF